MWRRKAEHTLGRVLAIYIGGLVAGMQIALYLFDLYDEGTADIRSLVIGLLFLAAGVVFAVWRFRRSKPGKAPQSMSSAVTPRLEPPVAPVPPATQG
jgi:hypothetical protein